MELREARMVAPMLALPFLIGCRVKSGGSGVASVEPWPSRCSEDTCKGCCDASGVCQPSNDAHCGLPGEACQACGHDEHVECLAGVCQDTDCDTPQTCEAARLRALRYTPKEIQALKDLIDVPATASKRTVALRRLAENNAPSLWDYWAKFELRSDFTEDDIPSVIAGLRSTGGDKARDYLEKHLERPRWHHSLLVDPSQWPLTSERLEALARDPANAEGRAGLWCAALTRASGERSDRLRDELLAGPDHDVRVQALSCGRPLPSDALKALAEKDDSEEARWAAPAYFQTLNLTARANSQLEILLRLMSLPNSELGRLAADAFNGRLVVLDSNQCGRLAPELSSQEEEMTMEYLARNTDPIKQDPELAARAGLFWEMRGEVSRARQAYLSNLAAFDRARQALERTDGKDPELSSLRTSGNVSEGLLNLAILDYSLGELDQAEAARAELALGWYSVGTIDPANPFSGACKDVARALRERYADWLETTIALAPNRKGIDVKFRNRSAVAHVLHLRPAEWTTSGPGVPGYLAVWVGCKKVDQFDGQTTGYDVDQRLMPRETWTLRVPEDLSRERRPFRLALTLGLSTDDDPEAFRSEVISFIP